MPQQWLRRNPTLTGKTNGYFGGKKDEMDSESSKGLPPGGRVARTGLSSQSQKVDPPLLPPMRTKVAPRPSGTSSRETNQPSPPQQLEPLFTSTMKWKFG